LGGGSQRFNFTLTPIIFIDNLLVTEHKYTTEFSWGSLQKLRRKKFSDPWNLMRVIPT